MNPVSSYQIKQLRNMYNTLQIADVDASSEQELGSNSNELYGMYLDYSSRPVY